MTSIVYAAVRHSLRAFALDLRTGALEQRSVTDLRTDIHYVAIHPTRRYVYVAASDRAQVHLMYAFAIEETTGATSSIGEPFAIPPALGRAVHISVDRSGRYLLTAHNLTESVGVLRLAGDGGIADVVAQPEMPPLGFLVHQIRADRGNAWVLVPVRGNDGPPELVGRLHVFSFADGVLRIARTLDYESGIGPRHLEFHSRGPWLYLLAERGNQLITYRQDGATLTELFRTTTLRDLSLTFPAQRAGAIHLHPNGAWLYVTNRNTEGGENTIALFSIDGQTGKPALIDHVDSAGVEPRTFAIDRSGTFLIVANMMNNLTVFRIRDDGRLRIVRSYDQPDGGVSWVGAC